ncbi:mandelate racemase/muconate lactonizing enzyme family protein [Brevibacillus reuszeri]|uniref:mandelate racemase/muconate lactonizing enzyme family protein n=1 Tax=Brevibacillus reuszeri TaxID=54915 RepID=UPI000CCC152C|nr:dipeptide epimerase [Brevibacillus reuszeri]
MKIVSVEVFATELPLVRPFIVAYDTFHKLPSIIVKMTTDTGIVGYGEGMPDPHVTGESFYSTYEMLSKDVAPLLIGENPFAIEKLHKIMAATVYHAPTAKAAIDIACYDIMGKATGQPVYNLLGGKMHASLSVPFVISILPPEEMASQAAQAVADGYTSIKIKVGDDPATDVKRIRAVREAIGENVQLRVDANQGWRNVATTMRVLKQVEDCEMEWIEQPVLADDIIGLAEVRQKTTIPVMIDEGLHGDKEMREVIMRQAADLINIKLMKCGGLYPACKLVAQAEIAGLGCQVGSMVESSIATAAGAHLSIAKSMIFSNEMVGPLMFSKDFGKLHYEKDQLMVTDRPGLGVDVDEVTVQELSTQSTLIQ